MQTDLQKQMDRLWSAIEELHFRLDKLEKKIK